MKTTDQDRINICQEYAQGVDMVQLGRKYNCCPTNIKQILKARGVSIRSKNRGRKYKCDDQFFDVIDTEEKAYWLGFIYAEGSIYHTTLAIEVASEDEEILFAFKKSINAENPVTRRKAKRGGKIRTYSRIRISSYIVVDSIQKHGVVPRKTNYLSYPSIPEELNRHFIRGFMDGDGWITMRQRTKRTKTIGTSSTRISQHHDNVYSLTIGFASNSRPFIEKMQTIINQSLSIDNGSIVQRKNKKCCQLCYEGNNIPFLLASWLYEEASLKCQRKFDVFNSFASLRAEWPPDSPLHLKKNRL